MTTLTVHDALPISIFITYNFYQIERKTASDYKEQLEAGIQAKQYHNTRLRNMLSGKTQEQRKEENHLPIMIIGTSQETGDIVYQSRSEEHTSELQSRFDLVCRLLHEKK